MCHRPQLLQWSLHNWHLMHSNRKVTFLAAAMLSVMSYSRGPLVMIGGGLEEDNEVIWSRMIQEAGGQGVSVRES